MRPPDDTIPLPPEPVEDDMDDERLDPRDGDKVGTNLGSKPVPMHDSLMEALRLKAKLDAKRRALRQQEQP